MDLENKRTEIISRMMKTAGKGTPEDSVSADAVAIIGLSGYFPQSMDMRQFWDALDGDWSLIGEIPNSRIDWENLYDPSGKDPNKSNTRWGGIIPDIRNFDPEFFGILPGEAALMDPRKRLLLMSVYHAMEDAGYAPGSFKNSRSGVFVAIEEDEYNQCMRESGIDVKAGSGSSSSLIANQISWFFDLRGPSEVINTMCSGGAVAIHRAVNAIRTGKLPVAIVGAANLLLHADPFIFLSRTGQMSPDNSVRSFGKDARGFLRADGVASVILKPLSAAVEDGDAIYAVIKNSAINYNGRGGMSMAMPNISSHADLIRTCYTESGIDPQRVSYIEAQGMGNPVADVAEWEACNRALEAIAKEKGLPLKNGGCRISTLKPMLGHMHAASAMGALFKIIRSFQTNKIHKIIDLDEINPDLDTQGRPCRLVTATEDWPEEADGRLAGLHSYGSGGNNAHILLEEYKPRQKGEEDNPSGRVIVPFSANTEGQCKKAVQRLLDFMIRYPEHTLPSIAYTLQTGRDAMRHRVAFMAETREEFIKKAGAYLEGDLSSDELPAEVKAWAEGASISWDKAAFKNPVRRLHLPVYPFDCREYWLDTPGVVQTGEGRFRALEEAEQIVRELLNAFLLNASGDIDPDRQFSDLGFDSQLVTKLSHGLHKKYGLSIEPAIFFELTTPRQLMRHISGEMEAKKKQGPGQDIATKGSIAIIGVSGNFPQSPSIDILWRNLVNGNNCIEEVPEDRWSASEHFHPDKETANRAGKSYGKWGGFIKDFYHFDPLFFKISPSETELMSPKERLFLQCAWNVLEDAGYTPQALAGEQVGVFAGVTRGGIDPYKTSMFTISNRVSYIFNLNGPSMTIDTACSSSLVAIHEACQHIHSGECSVALAGGVHAFLDPSHFGVLSGMYMLSPDGLSKSFGDKANGMVPGEGVGIVLLKSLERAIADKDIIYGVIKGSATNHGGKTNGFTVPNPAAQQRLIESALRKAGVRARDVSYVEAHGTGTPLGDPIEIRGLAEAFKKDSSDAGYCRIGSIKSNIGHLEAAAGVSGLIKILLQMKHGKLVPSLHSRELNPQINFSKTPFIVQQELEDWEPKDKDGKGIARIACVSSFGAGGANAHLVIEEYRDEAIQKASSSLPVNNEASFVILLSAKNKDRLQELARQLLDFLRASIRGENPDLADLAYTLRMGRVALEEKLAIEVLSLEDLERKLDRFLAGQADIGVVFDWGKQYEWPKDGQREPRRISVPGYPFMKEHYGLPRIAAGRSLPASSGFSVLHPLVQENTSTFQEQKFSSLFTGAEFFLRDHVVDGEKFLPGVAYLEMAAAAMEIATRGGDRENGDDVTVGLKNIAWIQPIVVRDKSVPIHIRFYKETNGDQSFEIYSEPGSGRSGNRVIHSQGSVLLRERVQGPVNDIGAIRNAAGLTIYTRADCYEMFAGIGVAYGPAHTAIEQLYADKQQILAQLKLPAVVSGTLDQFGLHPSLLDGAFQSIMGFMMPDREKYKDGLPLMIPFALEELTVFHPCTADMWAFIRMNGRTGLAGDRSDFDSLSFDIDLMDGSGKVCVRMKKYTARMLKRAGDGESFGTLLIRPAWEEQEIPAQSEGADIRTIDLSVVSGRIDQYMGDCTLRLFEELQRILKGRPANKVLLRLILSGQGEQKILAALYGLLKTAEIENPAVSGEIVIRENGRKLVRVLHEYVSEDKEAGHPWRDGGMYLVTGGMGGLGLILAREILTQTKGARLILTGRSSMDENKQSRLTELSAMGGAIEYRQMDVADAGAVNELIQDICRETGNINGIIHCAGTLNDGFILTKDKDSLAAVLAPKVQGLVNLDDACKQLSPDIFILCSSSSSVMGNAGQGDYAAANAFMDEYALYRNTLVSKKERRGHTISVNWPLWKDGGMRVDETTEAMMFEKIGMTPMDTAGGLQALYQAIVSGHGQIMVMHGDKRRLRSAFFKTAARDAGQGRKMTGAPELTDGVKEKSILYFKKLLSGAIKLSADRIGSNTPLEEYGIDSIMVMQMTGELEKVFGSLPKTLFFEYRDISELTGYFITAHAEKLNALLGAVSKGAAEEKQANRESLKTDRFVSIPSRPVEKKKEEEAPDIAIIGLSGRYPQARNVREFWDNLRNGKNSITEIPEDRWDHSLYFDTDKKKAWKTYSKWGGFLDGVDEFDPLFFNISPREAELLDPQERLFLQCVYEALEDAGYTRQLLGINSVQGRVGVYAGVMWNEYQLYAAQETALGRPLALSSSPSSIANRISYFFNFNGPSLAVDTMCSSSLTAIHLACQSLRQGGCEVAVAGGVNVTIHPNKYLVLGYGKVASSKGLCESFGKDGDGYVPSEGVGAVLLKPLSKAVADRDHIYGVIKGTAINHGGKVNGYTVPNPRAQAKVIGQALKESGFDPRTISYIEAHGTGTALGDPIEIAGLAASFNCEDRQFCAIGSAKSNIGHCESAAGIAGVTKVLLQIQHRQIVPSLHSKELNPGIDFENSPFIVQQELTEWRRPVLDLNGKISEYPRRAGVSSFGAGGSNAHVVIEEYIPDNPHRGNGDSSIPVIQGNSVAILLSARSEDRLKEQARQLLAAVQTKSYADKDLADMAYTLQIGRESMEERLAIEVTSITELEEKLASFIRGREWIENLYAGKTKVHKEILSFFNSDEDMEKAIESWLKKKKYTRLLGLWVNGFDFDWEKLYADASPEYSLPQRISLPVYPFMRDRYWPEIGSGKSPAGSGPGMTSILHPLVHQNTSTFTEQKFSSTFHGGEFFLKDHLVNGEKILPGVAYIEMINIAMSMAGGQQDAGVHFENMVWEQPLRVNGHPEKVDIGLIHLENGKVRFAIQSQPDMDGSLPFKYSQGTVSSIEKGEFSLLDIDLLKSQMNRPVVSADDCYGLFSKMGISYGPAHRSIETIYIGEGQALAKLRLPQAVVSTLDQYYLHPSLMDASLQAVIGLLAHRYTDTTDIPLAIPFAIKSLVVAGRCASDMWAFIRFSAGQGNSVQGQDIGQLSFDIDVCDATGKLCVQIQGFTTRILRKEGRVVKGPGVLMIEPFWQRKEIVSAGVAISAVQRLIVVIGNGELAGALPGQLPGARVVQLQDSYLSIAAGFENYAIPVFREVKQLLASKPKNKVLVQVIVAAHHEKQVFLGIAGLLKTAGFENPLFAGQVIGMEQGEPTALIIDRIKENGGESADTVIRYNAGGREVFCLREYSPGDVPAAPIWKDAGVYLITGGAGGLGLIFANEIMEKTKGATVILTGRSVLNEEREKQLDVIRSLGLRVEYKQTDIADDRAVESLVQNILEEFGQLHGIIHSAGVTRDNFILRKPEEEIREVFAPKVRGLFNLDVATRDIPLDFFIVCSSGTGITGNAGQADYAMANAYMDRYAEYRDELARAGQRSGKTLSVNWPLWKEGGMQIPKENERLLLENTGMIPMATGAGLNALYRAMAVGSHQMMVLQGELTKLRAVFLGRVSEQGPVSGQERAPAVIEAGEADRAEALDFFRKVLSATLKLSADQINPDKPMEEYGIDSVMVMQMTNELEKVFGSLSKTLFFEYQNISELTGYFQEQFPEKLKELLGSRKAPVKNETPGSEIRKDYKSRFAFSAAPVQQKKAATDALDIAIIGLSGTYPQARDIDGFWKILKEGRNCITEIPAGRWDHSHYFDKNKNQPGKTYGKWGGFLDGVDEFDPLFFNITPKEAAIMDPQERLFLQCVYETMEDAGYARGASSNMGVFVGVMNDEYQLYGSQETALGRPLVLSGNSASIANRVSYYFNYNGPSIALNTMCSSSLTAIHLACQSLRLGECETAVAGGVNVNVHPNKYVGLAYGKFLSSKGLCESFGAGGDGYVPGEGVGAVLLKPLAAALADNDHIYGVIKGTAVNHGGKTNGYTVPNPVAQGNAIAKAIKMAGFDPRTISYLEAHGTGTFLGDPIEITGLKRAFDTRDNQFCSIGSVKTNIGHCESAAGIAGITKVLLQMKHGQLVPSLHAEEPNHNIDFENSPFFIQRELAVWRRPLLTLEKGTAEFPRRAGISSFGAGGANAHILIEEYIADSNSLENESLPVRLSAQAAGHVVLYAKGPVQLKQQAERLLKWIEESGQRDIHQLADLVYTLRTGREMMEERLTIGALSFLQLEERLKRFIAGEQGIDGVYVEKVNEVSPVDLRQPRKGDSDGQEDSEKAYRPKKISLPVYPFERRRCWFEQPAEIPKGGVLLEKRWEPAPAVRPHGSCRQAAILYSSETKELAAGLKERLSGSVLINIHDEMAFDPDRLKQTEWKKFDGFIDLIGYSRSSVESLEWIQWLQQLIEYGDRSRICLLGVTGGLSSFQNDDINLTGAYRAGLYRMLSSEYSHVVSRHVDIEDQSPVDVAADQILTELSIRDEEPEVCYRNGKRYRTLLQERAAGRAAGERLLFSGEQVLWITGGTRGLGYLCAQHFVKEYGVKRLVLTGYEPIPSREKWSAYRGEDSPLAQKIKNLVALEDMGATIKVLSVPLTDRSILQKELYAIKEEWGGIHGIIHCAGIGDHENPAFIRKSLKGIQKVMDPKVKGLNNLYQCCKKEPLEFFLLFSSVSAIIPSLGAGQAVYGMANAYMDHFAAAKADSCPLISIQWPSWKETGMGEVKSRAYQHTGLLTLTDSEGLRLLDRVIQERPGPVVLPAQINRDSWEPGKLLKYAPRTEHPVSHHIPPEKTADLIPAAGADAIRDWLTDLFAKELKLEATDLKPDKPFQDYGIDSILIMQLLHPIQKKLGKEIDPSILFEYPTIRSFGDWLGEKFPDDFARVAPGNGRNGSDIAVVGMACRFPGAKDLDAYWDLLKEGRSAIQAVPRERWNSANSYSAGLIDDPYSFDPKFFFLHENDARAMDPQALLVLEETLKLFCHAGYTLEEVKGRPIGVYIGGRSKHIPDTEQLRLSRNPILTVGQNYLSSNISQFFDLRGPSIVVDTACSSALVAMNMAIQALQNKETEAAVVGGVSLLNTEETHRLFEQRGLLSKSTDFHILDKRAGGIILGEGAGLVLLKTVDQALAAGDHIYAIIKSVAINNDGRTAGPATPNIEAQKEIMRAALAKCNKRPEEISYIEVNGSGSEVTDLIEMKAINAVYRSSSSAPCKLGSIKPNIGHPLCAEGIASFIKVVKMLHDQQFVPFLSGHQPMKFFDLEASAFSFSRGLSKWPGVSAVGAINCFADGGTNAHVIVEAWQDDGGENPDRKRRPIPAPALYPQDLRGDKVLAGSAPVNGHPSIWETFE